MKYKYFFLVFLILATKIASAERVADIDTGFNSRDSFFDPAHVSIRNLAGAIVKAVITDVNGGTLALLHQVNLTTFKSKDKKVTITNVGHGFFKNIRVTVQGASTIYYFACRKFVGVVAPQPDGTRNSLECQPYYL